MGNIVYYEDIQFPDNVYGYWGTNNELRLWHNGTNSYVFNYTTGNLYIGNSVTDGDTAFLGDDGSGGEEMYFRVDGGDENVQFSHDVLLYDNVNLKIGSSGDFQAYHNGSTTYLRNNTGTLEIRNQTSGASDVYFKTTTSAPSLDTFIILDGSAEQTQFTKDTEHQDGVYARFGNSSDLSIVHTGSTGYIQNYTGDLQIQTNATDSDILFRSDDGSGGLATYMYLDGGNTRVQFNKDARFIDSKKVMLGTGDDLQLYHTGSLGMIDNQVGDLIIKVSQDDGDMIFQSDNGSGAIATYFRIDGGDTRTEFELDTLHLDGIKAGFGNDADLQIYHDGSNSYISSVDPGSLYIKSSGGLLIQSDTGEDMIYCVENGAVNLYYNDSKKFETTNTGVAVTGDIELDDNEMITWGGNSILQHTGTITYIGDNSSGSAISITGGNTTFGGNVLIPSNLQHVNDDNNEISFTTDAQDFRTNNSSRLDINNAGVRFGGAGARIVTVKDEDDMAADSNVALATQQSIKAYVDAEVSGAITGVLKYQGTWNANTNSPTLSSGSGTPGYYYIVSVAGSTNLDGITDWAVGDWAVFSDQATDAWQKIDNTAVGNVNGSGGANYVTKWTGSGTIANSSIIDQSGTVTFSGNIVMGDNDITGIDELIWTSGTTLTDNSTNYLQLNYASNGAGGIIVVDGDSGTQGYLYADGNATSSFGLLDGSGSWAVKCVEDAEVELRYDNSKKFETTNTGVTITGIAVVDGLDLGDNEQIRLGAGHDLKLYSNGTDGYVYAPVDDLILQAADDVFIYVQDGENAIICQGNAGVLLHYNNANVLETVADGAQTKFNGGGGAIGYTIHNEGTNTADDSRIAFETQGQLDWVLGIDRSATAFKISRSDAFGTNDVLTLDNSSDALFASDVAVTAKLAVGVNAVHASYDLYNQGTFYCNGNATVNANLTVDAGSISITADGSNAATLTESGSGDFTIHSQDDLRLNTGGQDIVLQGDSVEFGRLTNDNTNFEIKSSVSDKDIIFKGVDNTSEITALTLDMSAAGAATFNSNITLLSRITFDYGGDHYLESGTNTWNFKNSSGSTALTINHSDQSSKFFGNVIIPSYIYHKDDPSDDTYFGFSGNDTFVVYTAGGNGLNIDSNRDVTLTGSLTVPSRIYHSGDTDTYIGFPAADHFDINCGNTTFLSIDGTNLTLAPSGNVNVNSADVVLSGDSNIVLDTSVSSGQSSGTIIKIGGHMSALVAGNIYYMGNSMGSAMWYGADADSSSTENMLALSLGTDADVDGMLLEGIYHKASHGLTTGEPIYLSNTPMSMTNTAPSGASDYVRVLGYAIDSNHIYFRPDNTWVKISS